MMKPCLVVFNIWSSNEFDDLSASYYDAVNHLKALSLNEVNPEVTRVGNPIDEVQESSYQLNNWPARQRKAVKPHLKQAPCA